MSLNSSGSQILSSIQYFHSAFLNREVTISVLLPAYYDPTHSYPLLLFNDGQDFEMLDIVASLEKQLGNDPDKAFLVAGIHADHDRIYEYGTAIQPDYAGRGNKAADTTKFVLHELLPFLKSHYNIKMTNMIYAGFSLGGLMALDMVWSHPEVFSAAGVFSGALWWRQKALNEGYNDSDRIMHRQIEKAAAKPGLKFWFQCGSLDESDDRDGDGVIDSIQDTLECIAELERKGYVWNKDVFYLEVPDGYHNQETWSAVLPVFFEWVSASTLE
ncbi:MAG: alpha/beta hydrolase-fold protein [Dyadobacter sp.]|uniref:alpha/beta hydrolase n=1 Tax=Dyadobacter sp. TaxID=1914288 RepID=UPI0032656443